jgi:uncharacterized glyoxalase superfamily protein PhnB
VTLRSIVPYLVIEGAAAAIDWYRDVLGAVEVDRQVGGAGRVAHAELRIDDVVALFERMVAAGATPIRQPTAPDLPLQTAKVRDPFGHVWLLSRSSEP